MHELVAAPTSRLQQVLQQVKRLGSYPWPVLLLGETGTGKEMVARALHEVSPKGPFVTIDCSAMVGTLMESELFGHAKGAFTGAAGQKTGLIEMANGGTAFFDEIGELPLEMQSKLLRVLQEKEFRPVGGLVQKRSDFRVIAATNRDLQRDVDRGAFRRDLYFRLNVVSLRLPSLRDRAEDIPLLVRHFLGRYGRNHQVAPETMDLLASYDWPGNVRELENCIKHLVMCNSGPLLHDADLPSAIRNFQTQQRLKAMAAAAGTNFPSLVLVPPRPAQRPAAAHDALPITPLAELEQREIERALEYTRGDKVMAAALLGIGRTTLYRKLSRYGLEHREGIGPGTATERDSAEQMPGRRRTF
jgi:transcriptional regulator with PAS, ATPase and Fis domain